MLFPFNPIQVFSFVFLLGFVTCIIHGNSWPSNEMSEISFRGNTYWMINRSQYIICILPIWFYNYMSLQIYIWIISLQWDKWFLPFMESSMIFYFISNNKDFNSFQVCQYSTIYKAVLVNTILTISMNIVYNTLKLRDTQYHFRQVKVPGPPIIYIILTFVITSELSICNKIILRFI